MSAIAECDRLDAAGWAPPPPAMSVYDFARKTILVSGPLAGSNINPEYERAIHLWLEMLATRKYRWHVQIAPSQRGKTVLGVLVPLMHALIERRVNAGWVMPNLDKLGQKWTGDFQPTLEASGFLRYLPSTGPASRGGRPAAMNVRDPVTRQRFSAFYAMALGKGGSETSTASNPCVFLAIDEADDAENLGQLVLTMKRTSGQGAAGGGIVASTVNERRGRDLHPILELYEDTTKTRLAHLCQHCHEHVVPDLEHFNADTATIACPACGVIWSEADRHAARNAGIYKHQFPDAEWFGIKYVAIDYFWEYPDPATGKVETVIHSLAREHKSALAAKERGDPSPWNTYLRKCWCRPEDKSDADVPAIVPMLQAARSSLSTYDRGVIPDGCTVTTIGADTGKTTSWWLRLAMKPDLSWYIIDWSRKRVDETETSDDGKREPTPPEQVGMLDRLRDRAGRIGRADAMGIDAGYNTDLVVPWARRNGFRLVRGDYRRDGRKETPYGKKLDDRNRNLPSWAEDRQQDDGSFWLFLNGTVIKTEIAKALAREPNSPGAGHMPRGQQAHDWLIKHLTSETWVSEFSKWEHSGRPNHLWDCLVYAWALSMMRINVRRVMPQRKYGEVGSPI